MRDRRPKSATEKKKSKPRGDFKGPVKLTPGTAKEEPSLCPVPLWCCLDRAVTTRFGTQWLVMQRTIVESSMNIARTRGGRARSRAHDAFCENYSDKMEIGQWESGD